MKTPQEIYSQAHTEGMVRTWMHTNTYGSRYVLLRPLGDDIDYTKDTYYVADGMCGFAWINIKPDQR